MKNFIRKLFKNKKHKDPILKTEIYTYQFPNGKVYVGFTTNGLNYIDWFHRTFSNPVLPYLYKYSVIKPRVIKTVMLRKFDDEIYKYMREVMDERGYNPQCLLNRNLKLYGYDVSKLKPDKIRRTKSL